MASPALVPESHPGREISRDWQLWGRTPRGRGRGGSGRAGWRSLGPGCWVWWSGIETEQRLPLKVRCHAVSFFGIHSPPSHSAEWYCQPCNSPASPRLCLLPPQVRFHPLSILTSSQRPKTSLCLGHPCSGSANVCTGLTSCLVQQACGMFYRCSHYAREDTQTLGRVIGSVFHKQT